MIKVHTIPMGMALAYLVESEAGLVLVDAGIPGYERSVLRLMGAIDRDDLRLIYITHAHLDHYGSAAALRRQTGAPVAIHHADANSMAHGETLLGTARGRGKLMQIILPVVERFMRPEPVEADISLDDGETLSTFGLDALVLHTPGHTPGSSCLLVEDQYAFVGDLLSSTSRPRAQRFYADDWSLIPESIARLKTRDPERVFTGHGRRPINRDELGRIEPESR